MPAASAVADLGDQLDDDRRGRRRPGATRWPGRHQCRTRSSQHPVARVSPNPPARHELGRRHPTLRHPEVFREASRILVGSTRPGRKGSAVGRGCTTPPAIATTPSSSCSSSTTSPPTPRRAGGRGSANRNYERESTRAWSRAVDGLRRLRLGHAGVQPRRARRHEERRRPALPGVEQQGGRLRRLRLRRRHPGRRAVAQHPRGGGHVHHRSQVALQNFADWKDGEFTHGERRTGEPWSACSTRSWRRRRRSGSCATEPPTGRPVYRRKWNTF